MKTSFNLLLKTPHEMQNTYYSRNTSIFIISLLEFLERFSYYGSRALVILYLVDEIGLQTEDSDSLTFYGIITVVGGIMVFPAALLSDLIFKQKKAILIGSIISLPGYLLLQGGTIYIVLCAMVLIMIGTSFVRVNLAVLLGRLYIKSDNRRSIAFLIYYFGVNVGAFIGMAGIGYVGDIYGWNYGFYICAIATFFFIIIFLFIQNKLNLIEEYPDGKQEELNPFGALDEHLMKNDKGVNEKKKANKWSLLILSLLILVNGLFWRTFELVQEEILVLVDKISKIELFGFEILRITATSLESYVIILFLPLLAIIYHRTDVGSYWRKIAMALIIAAGSIFVIKLITPFATSNFHYVLLPIIMLGIGEVLLTPFIMSYVTRIAPLKFSATFFSLNVVGAISFGKVFGGYLDNVSVVIGLTLVSGVLILIFRKQLIELAGGLD